MSAVASVVSRACAFPGCCTLLARDTIASGSYLCGPHRGRDELPLGELDRAELVAELALSRREASARELAPPPAVAATQYPCGHERTPGNTMRDLDRSRLDADGNPRRRERCKTCKRARDARRDRRAA